jgi:AraC-like DNA-binding protein
VIFYINKHFHEPLDLCILSNVAHLTPKYLSKRFLELSGIPLSQYLQEVRLHYARNLVMSTTLPLKQICAQSGFSTTAHFSRCFRQKYGCSPSQMRRDRI